MKKLSHENLLNAIVNYVQSSTGLSISWDDEGKIKLFQKTDERAIQFWLHDLGEVLDRVDKDGKRFIQVNFVTGRKILITDTLVGFKPEPRTRLDLSKLPKVVTTPDLWSVFEAIEDLINSDEISTDEDLEILKEVYHSILQGGELVGFDLKYERLWLSRLLVGGRASA